MRITNNNGYGEFVVGDLFNVTFSVNDSVKDTSASTNSGQFNSALSSFLISRVATNTGTWNPTGIFATPATIYTEDGPQERFRFRINASGFPSAGGKNLGSFFFEYSTSTTGNITDTGLGQSLASQFTTGKFSPATFAQDRLVFFDFGSDSRVSAAFDSLSSPTAVPEPSSVLLLGCIAITYRLLRQKKINV